MAGQDWFSQFIKELERVFSGTPQGHGKLLRPRHPRSIAGVCSGIAAYYGWDVNVTRFLALVLITATSGLALAGYAVGWVLIPDGPYALPGDVGATKS